VETSFNVNHRQIPQCINPTARIGNALKAKNEKGNL